MKLTLRYLVTVLAVTAMQIEAAYGQVLRGDALGLRPTTMPIVCNTGDLRVDSADSNKLKLCVANTWSGFPQATGSLVASKVVVTNASGNLATSTASSTEAAFLLGVTSTLCGINQACTLTNKSIAAGSNTITGLAIGTEVGATAPGNFVVTGGLSVTGASSYANNLTVAGTLNSTGVATFATHVGIGGNATVTGTLVSTGAATLASHLTVGGNSTVTGGQSVTGASSYANNLTVAGTLNTTGVATFATHISAGGNATVTGTFNSTGAATLLSHLTVGGNTTLSGALDTAITTAGVVTSSSAGVVSSIAVLPVALGGTNNETLSVATGVVFYGDGTKVMGLAAGNSGQVLQSAGAAAPSWVTLGTNVTAVTGSYTATTTNDVIIMSGVSQTLSLAAASNTGKLYRIIKNGGQNTAYTINATISGVASLQLPKTGDFVEIIADGSTWHLLSSHISSYAHLHTATAFGTTNTKIRHFLTVAVSLGNTFTVAGDTAAGTSITINLPGIYSFVYCDNFGAGGGVGLSLNSNQLSASISSGTLSEVTRLSMALPQSAHEDACVSWTGPLAASDVVRPHTDGGTAGANAKMFHASRVP